MSNIPDTIRDNAHELTSDGLIHLYRLTLVDGTEFLICPWQEVTWQSEVYEQLECVVSGVTRNAEGRNSRPKLTVANPMGLFSAEVGAGGLDNATLLRHRIAPVDFQSDNGAAITEVFKVAQIVNFNKNTITMELRSLLDGRHFQVPARRYIPPEFPHVRL